MTALSITYPAEHFGSEQGCMLASFKSTQQGKAWDEKQKKELQWFNSRSKVNYLKSLQISHESALPLTTGYLQTVHLSYHCHHTLTISAHASHIHDRKWLSCYFSQSISIKTMCCTNSINSSYAEPAPEVYIAFCTKGFWNSNILQTLDHE